jgi:hypothetical protein
LKREYRHFLGDVGDKNTIEFVVGAWKQLLNDGWLRNIKTVKVWSDGGPKHFKISSNMKFFLAIQQAFPEKQWIYSFFAPYHGCSICDGVAAHAKGILNRTSRDENLPIRTADLALKTIQKLENHSPSSVQLASNDFSTPTLHGIKKYFKFTFDSESNWICAYLDNSETEYSKQYHPQQLIDFLDIQ